jgi:hypothetical protein
MDSDRLKRLVSDIQGLSQVEVEEIFKIIHESKCDYTKNNNGIFVNLAWLQSSTIEKIDKYVRFCTQSKKELTKYESLCDVLNHKMYEYTEGDTPPVVKVSSNAKDKEVLEEEKLTSSKISSSLRYYLLKKRYSKQQVQSNVPVAHLSKDTFSISDKLSESP